MVILKHDMVGDIINTQLPSFSPKLASKNYHTFPFEFPFLSCMLTLTLPKVDCTHAHAFNN